jgi:hypothetical protein
MNALTFSADGQHLASAAKDATVLVWAPAKAHVAAAHASIRSLDSLWDELGHADASVAFRAAAELARRPGETLSLFRARIPTAAPVKADQVQTLIADLNADSYPVREKASRVLEQFDTLAEPFLVKALAAKPPVESAKRLQVLLDRLEEPVRDSDKLRLERAVELLERIGSRESVELLSQWAQGAPEARLTRRAQAARDRLAPSGSK